MNFTQQTTQTYSKQETQNVKIKLDRVRYAFPGHWQAQAFQGDNGGQPASPAKYQGTFLMPPDHGQVKALTTLINSVGQQKWGEKWAAYKTAMKNEQRLCLQNGDNKPDYQGFPGNLFLRASSKTRPLVLDRDGRTHLREEDGRPYGGCYVNVSVDIYAHQHQRGGKRVLASFLGIQFVGDGDAFGAGPPAKEDDFADLGSEGGSLEFGNAVEEEEDALI